MKWRKLLLLCCLVALALIFWARNVLRQRSASSQQNIADIQQYAQTHPNDLHAQIAWGNALMLHEEAAKAMLVFASAARHWPQDARPYIGLGVLAVQEHRDDIALVNLEQAVRYNPSNGLVWHLLGDIYSHHKAPYKAIHAFQKATQFSPADAVAWRQLGVLEAKHKLYASGFSALKRATTLSPNDVEAQIDFGNIALVQGQLSIAQNAFKKAQQLQPNNPDALLGLANVMIQLDPSPVGLSQALSLAQRASVVHPSAIAYETLGHISLIQKQYQQAIRYLQKSIALDKKRTSPYVLLSQAYGAIGDAKAANTAGKMYQELLKKEDMASFKGMGH